VTDARDRYIPVRKDDILSALTQQRASADPAGSEKFRRLCEMMAAIYHYENFATLERLRSDYYYFNPQVAHRAIADPAMLERCYDDLLQSLDRVLKVADFTEMAHAEVGDAHDKRAVLRVAVNARLGDFREIRFYRRGHHKEYLQVAEWFGLRRREVKVQVFDDVVLFAAMRPKAEIGSRRELKRLERRKIAPGSVLLKYFHNIAAGDLKALFPNARVVMRNVDKIALGVPALASGIPILINLYTTITVLFLVIGFYLGLSASVEDKDMKTALAALSALVAFGGFIVTQWVRYQRQSLKYQTELTDNIYYRNVNNNSGIFDYVIGAAEEQQVKEAFLAYHFLHVANSPPVASELDSRVEEWLRATFAVDVDFDVGEAVVKLEQLGLLRRDGERLIVAPFDEAYSTLRGVWGSLFPAA
jgi:Protein of unknown function (DUF3754)